jgi:hypothetical protein
MPHAGGPRLGPSEIIAAIAAGGMGEVYKARDTRRLAHTAGTLFATANCWTPRRQPASMCSSRQLEPTVKLAAAT